MLPQQQQLLSKRVAQWRYPFFILPLLFSLFTAPAIATASETMSIEEVRMLASTGVPLLAIRQIDEIQKSLAATSAEWLQWEKERIALYQQNQFWSELDQRVSGYASDMDGLFLRQAKTRQLEALLKLGRAEQVRHYAHALIWSEGLSDTDEIWFPLWQRLIMRSYIQQGMAEDAFLASTRFYQQYHTDDQDDLFTRARILLMNNRAEEVVEMLAGHTKSPEGGMLYLLAQLRSKARTPHKVIQSAYRQMRGKWVDKQLKYNLWSVVAEASRLAGDRATNVKALEYVLGHQSADYLASGMYQFSADMLWNAYIDYATFISNQEQLLVGDFAQWLKKADSFVKKESIKARSLYASLILNVRDQKLKDKAVNAFIEMMRKTRGGAELVQELFLQSSYFQKLEKVPALVRYDLADISLSRSDIQKASMIMATLHAAPSGTDEFDWQLRRARILVMGARAEEAETVLLQLLKPKQKLNRKNLERLLQVVFDMQTVSAHRQALNVFPAILRESSDKEFQREVYFWMADSEKALANHAQAAFWYLRSALILDGKGLDPWGQTARYHAAESLAKAGLLADARNMYEFLLRVTKEDSRIAVLKHALQKLSLRSSSLDDEAGEVEPLN